MCDLYFEIRIKSTKLFQLFGGGYMRVKKKKHLFKISGGLIMFVAFLLLSGQDRLVFLPQLLAVVCHEVGHMVAVFLRKKKIKCFCIGSIGAKIYLDELSMSYSDEIIISLAGPLSNLILAILFLKFKSFSQVSLLLGIFNLIPAPFFDGYRVLDALLSKRIGSDVSYRVMRPVSVIFVLIIWFLSIYMLIRYETSFTLFLISCFLFIHYFKV